MHYILLTFFGLFFQKIEVKNLYFAKYFKFSRLMSLHGNILCTIIWKCGNVQCVNFLSQKSQVNYMQFISAQTCEKNFDLGLEHKKCYFTDEELPSKSTKILIHDEFYYTHTEQEPYLPVPGDSPGKPGRWRLGYRWWRRVSAGRGASGRGGDRSWWCVRSSRTYRSPARPVWLCSHPFLPRTETKSMMNN